MKKLLCSLLMVALIVCMTPAMAFAEEVPAETPEMTPELVAETPCCELASNQKLGVTMSLGAANASLYVSDQYAVNAAIDKNAIGFANISGKIMMHNVASLGVTGDNPCRSHSFSIATGLEGLNGDTTAELNGWFDSLYTGDGVSFAVNGTVNDASFVYNVAAGAANDVDGGINLTATPGSDAEVEAAEVEAVRTAWQLLTQDVNTELPSNGDSMFVLGADSYIQIGTEKLTFAECTINPNGGTNGLVTAIKDAATLKTVEADTVSDVIVYITNGSVIQLGDSSAAIINPVTIKISGDDSIFALEGKIREDIIGGYNGSGVLGFVQALVNPNVEGLDEAAAANVYKAAAYATVVSMVDYIDGAAAAADGKTINVDITFEVPTEEEPEEPGTPDLPPIDFGGFVPAPPKEDVTNETTNTDAAGTTTVAPTTNADVSKNTTTTTTTTGEVKAETKVEQTIADKIVEKAVENKSEEVVIDATASTATTADKTTEATVTIPTATVGAIAEKTEAAVTVKTDVAEITLDNTAAAAIAEQAADDGTISIVAVKTDEVVVEEETATGETEKVTEVHFELKVVCSERGVIGDFQGGTVTVTVPVPKDMHTEELVAVYIDAQGHYHRVSGVKNANGTFTFTTDHFSSYAVMTAEEAEAAIEAQKAAIEDIKFKLSSKLVKRSNGKKAVKLTWSETDVVFEGIEIRRSLKKNSGYGTKAYFTTKEGAESYTNTAVKKGTKYYYKARGFVTIDGEKVYTDWSYKAWRTVK